MPYLPDFTGFPIWANVAVFLISAAVVWITGTYMVAFVDRFADSTGMGKGFAGMLLLGGIVSLTEISTVSSAALTGSPVLALNNLLGSESINLFLLAAADPVSGRAALTSFVATPTMLLQGVLGIILLAITAAAMAVGDLPVFGIGLWSTAIFLLCLGALWMSARYERRNVWVAADHEDDKEAPGDDAGMQEWQTDAIGAITTKLAGAASVIFAAGFLLSLTGDAFAEQTGLGASLVGFLFVGVSTSLPELSTIIAAIRMKRHEMAVGDILGSNLFNVLLIFLAEIVYTGGPVLNEAGDFELVAALLAILMSGILLLGLLERRDWTLLKMGYDTLAMLLVFAAGVAILYGISA